MTATATVKPPEKQKKKNKKSVRDSTDPKDRTERIKLDKLPKYTEIKQMVEATLKRMLLEPIQVTQSPDIIVFQNGVLNLKEMDVTKAFVLDPEAPIKHSHAVWTYFSEEVWQAMAAARMHEMGERVEYDNFKLAESFLRERCPVLGKFIGDWFPRDFAAPEAILRWFGYCMTTDTRQHKFIFFYGPTRAGKGSLARLLCGLVGANNYSVANYSAFEDKFQAIGMHDRLVVTMEEVEATVKEHERRLGMLKKYLGGERIVWEDKYAKAFEDDFVGKIIMQSNEVLAYEDKGRSITARMIPMEFRESFYNSGEDAPEQTVFKAGEGDVISTIAAMMWYRMTRNRVRGAFDFKDEAWSLKHCLACRLGEGSLLLESHKVAWKFLVFKGEQESEKSEFKKHVKKKRFVVCTRNRLRDTTELLLEYTGKQTVTSSLPRVLKEAVRRDFPDTKETCYKISTGNRCRGWKGLYINVQRLKKEYPEIFCSDDGFDERVRNICG